MSLYRYIMAALDQARNHMATVESVQMNLDVLSASLAKSMILYHYVYIKDIWIYRL